MCGRLTMHCSPGGSAGAWLLFCLTLRSKTLRGSCWQSCLQVPRSPRPSGPYLSDTHLAFPRPPLSTPPLPSPTTNSCTKHLHKQCRGAPRSNQPLLTDQPQPGPRPTAPVAPADPLSHVCTCWHGAPSFWKASSVVLGTRALGVVRGCLLFFLPGTCWRRASPVSETSRARNHPP